MSTLRIPAPLQPQAGGVSELDMDCETVGDALNTLIAQHPSLRRHLFDDRGVLRGFVNVYLNDEDIRYTGGPSTRVQRDDVITIVPSVGGG